MYSWSDDLKIHCTPHHEKLNSYVSLNIALFMMQNKFLLILFHLLVELFWKLKSQWKVEK